MANVDHQNTWALGVCAKKLQLNRRAGAEVRTWALSRKDIEHRKPGDKQEVPDLDVWADVKSHALVLAPLTCNLG